MTYRFIACLFFYTLFSACSVDGAADVDASGSPSGSSNSQIDIKRLSSIVKTLASDEFEGRAPGGLGEEKTVAYLIERFQSLGLQPGGDNGKWTQAVPLIHTQVQGPANVEIKTAQGNQVLEQARDIEFSTTRPVKRIDIQNADLVFVGFGADAPERDWDDFGDIDLNGK
ncbi:MAG: hypothetical protein ACJA2D_000495, partial [Pseudohongiellaceae bacterium]